MSKSFEAMVRRGKRKARTDHLRWKQAFPPLCAKIEKALVYKRRLPKALAAEAAFHMADWITDLEDLHRLFTSKRWHPVMAQRILTDFIVHAPAHIAAAYRIIWGEPLTDVFEIGAVEGSGKGTRKPGSFTPSKKETRSKGKRKGKK